MIGALGGIVPSKRSAEDIFAGRITVTLGGRPFVLRVRSRRANRDWLAALDQSMAGVLAGLDASTDESTLIRALFGATDKFLDALVTYDPENLPSREAIDASATDLEIITAVLGVWRAANPLVDIALRDQEGPQGAPGSDGATPWPPSTPTAPGPTDGPPARSRMT